jgi:hypothetical protein
VAERTPFTETRRQRVSIIIPIAAASDAPL